MDSNQDTKDTEQPSGRRIPSEGFLIGLILMAAGFFLLMAQLKDVPEEINWRGPGLIFGLGVVATVVDLIVSRKSSDQQAISACEIVLLAFEKPQ